MASPQYSSVAGDGDWKAYYKKRQTDVTQLIERITVLENGGVPEADLTEIRSNINDLKQSVKDLQGITYPGTEYDDTEVQQAITNLKKRCTTLENTVLDIKAGIYDDSALRAELLAIKADVVALTGTKADTSTLYDEIAKLKAEGYDTTELEQKIKDIVSKIDGDFSSVSYQQQVNDMLEQWKNRSGPFAEIFSRLNALEHGDSGQPCANKSEIAAIKQRLEAAGI